MPASYWRTSVVASLVLLAAGSVARSATVVAGYYYPGREEPGSLAVDLNGDGTADLSVVTGPHGYVGTVGGGHLNLNSASTYVVTETFAPSSTQSGGVAATPLNAGDLIGPSSSFSATPGAIVLDNYSRGPNPYPGFGPLGDPVAWSTPHYAGLKLVENGQTYYGWIELSTGGSAPATLFDGSFLTGTATVYGWGLQTTPDTAIAAGQVPEPASLATIGFACFALCRPRTPAARRVPFLHC